MQFPSLCYSVTPGAQALSTCGCRAAAGTGPWYAASCAHPPLASSKKPFANAATRSVLFALRRYPCTHSVQQPLGLPGSGFVPSGQFLKQLGSYAGADTRLAHGCDAVIIRAAATQWRPPVRAADVGWEERTAAIAAEASLPITQVAFRIRGSPTTRHAQPSPSPGRASPTHCFA